jgi:hypothetical protein
MKLKDDFKIQFKNALFNEKQSFHEVTKIMLKNSKNDLLYFPFLFGKLSRNYPQMFAEDYANKIIEETFKFNENPILKNNLRFQLKSIEEFFNPITNNQFNLEYDKILETSLRKFSLTENLIQNFKKFQNFPLFLDQIFENDEADKFLLKFKGQIFNINDWIEYVKKLIQDCYNFEFDKSKSSKNIFRFVKKINENYYMGIEYDNDELKFQLKNNNLCFPQIDLIIFTNEFNKTIKYKKLESDLIWNLGSIQNPFFSLNGSISNYYVRLTSENNINGKFKGGIIAKKEKIGTNQVRIYNSDELAETLKLFSFYEFYFSSYFNNEYINYIKKSLEKCLK